MNPKAKNWLKTFLIESVVYGVLVLAYFFLVLHLMGDWLHRLYDSDRKLYATTALALMVCQGIVLEFLTRALLALARPRTQQEDE